MAELGCSLDPGWESPPCGTRLAMGPSALCPRDSQTPYSQAGSFIELCGWGLRVPALQRDLCDVLLTFNDAALFVGYLQGCVGLPGPEEGVWLGVGAAV